MNTDDKLQSDPIKSAAQLIADGIRDGELVADEPYIWGLFVADVAEHVYDKTREKAEAIRRARKLARKKMQREGLLPMKPRVVLGASGRGGPALGLRH